MEGVLVPLTASWNEQIIKDTGFKLCSNHTKIKMYKDKNMKNIPKIDNPMLTLGKQIIKKSYNEKRSDDNL